MHSEDRKSFWIDQDGSSLISCGTLPTMKAWPNPLHQPPDDAPRRRPRRRRVADHGVQRLQSPGPALQGAARARARHGAEPRLCRPRPGARMLRTGSTGTIGLVFSDTLLFAFTDPTTVAFLQGVAQACEQAKAGLLILPEAEDAAMAPL